MEGPIIVEQTVNAPIEKVWKAITDKDEMKKWYFQLEEFKAEPGFEFQFEGGTETNKYIHLCKIKEVDPPHKLSHSWRYEGYAGDTTVTFELFDEGDRTRVRLTHEGLETFPQDNPDFARNNFQMGWTEIITKSLKNYVENTNNI